jgi:hypothetical protein
MNLGLRHVSVDQLVVLVWLVRSISPQWMLWYDRCFDIRAVGVMLRY